MSKLTFQKQQLSVYSDIVNNNVKNVDMVTDFMLVNFDSFFLTAEKLNITPKQILKFIKNDSQLTKKVDDFIEHLNVNEFNKFKEDLDFILEGNIGSSYNKKNKDSELNEKNEELLNFLGDIDGYGISFLGNDNYRDFKDEVKALKSTPIESIPSNIAKQFITQLFAAEGALEWSVDGQSRMQSASLLEPLYKSPQVIALTQREFKSNPRLALEIGQEVASAINLITEWSMRPVNDSGGSTLTVANQKKLLSLCAEIINNSEIPIVEKDIYNSTDFTDVCERDNMEYGYGKPKKAKYESVQANLEAFKASIKFTAPKSKKKP